MTLHNMQTHRVDMHVHWYVCVGRVMLISWLSVEQQKVKTEQVMKLNTLLQSHRAAGEMSLNQSDCFFWHTLFNTLVNTASNSLWLSISSYLNWDNCYMDWSFYEIIKYSKTVCC